jgi:hypothetical protein
MTFISPITGTKILSALDNESSLWPLLVKDMVDNTGRSMMEYKRGGKGANHAGRERAIEEYATTAVWIGGRKAINHFIVDPIIRRCGLDPKVDIMLFLKQHRQQVPRWIVEQKSAYLTANIARFIVGTLIPVAIIGWAIPTINQAITRFKVTQEQKKQPIYPFPHYGAPPLRFGGSTPFALQKVAGLINNEFYGNVAIDMGISGGRLDKARNWVDFMETAVRESSIVLFLYFLGDYVKGHMRRFFDRTCGSVGDLTFDAINWLKTQKLKPQHWAKEVKFLESLNPKNAFPMISKLLNPKTGRFDHNPILELARLQRNIQVLSSEEAMSLSLYRNMFGTSLQNASHKFMVDPRYLLDIGELKETLLKYERNPDIIEKAGSWLKSRFARGAVKANPFAVTEELGIVNRFLKVANPQNFKVEMEVCLQKTGRYKLIAMFASYAISTVFLAWLSPMFQHWLTKKVTGSVDFPGVRQDV